MLQTARLAAQVSQERPHQLRQIYPIGLGPPRPPVHLDARRIDLVIDDPLLLSQRCSQ